MPNNATTTNPNCHRESLLIGLGSNDKMANEEVVGNKGDQEEGEDNEGRQ
jgi:hypothetical protein